MRLYNIYYVCTVCKDEIDENTEMLARKNSSGQIVGYQINGWQKCREALEHLRNIPCMKEYAESAYKTIGVIEREQSVPVISPDTKIQFERELKELKTAIEAIKRLYESLGIGHAHAGIDVKIPKCGSLKEYTDYLREIDFIFTQCPYLLSPEEEIRFSNVDVGSQWLTFVIASAGTFGLLNNLAKLVDKAIAIKSHLLILKQQEEMVRSMKMKNEVMEETVDVFKQMKQKVLSESVDELEADISKLKDGEERGKVEKTLEKLAVLIDKGVEIYSSIETPNEVKQLFPMNEDNPILPDNIVKLLESKESAEEQQSDS